MNIFAWNITLKNKRETLPEIDFDIFQIDAKNYFIMGADEKINSSKELIIFLEKYFWAWESYDISIESEMALEILSSEYEQGVYECVSFEGPQVDFDDILERFAESEAAIVVREAEISKRYGNKVVKVDFIY